MPVRQPLPTSIKYSPSLDMKPADAEIKEQMYGDSTRKLILTFQERNTAGKPMDT